MSKSAYVRNDAAHAVSEVPFVLRIRRRHGGSIGTVYQTDTDDAGKLCLVYLGEIKPLAYTAGMALLRAAVQASTPGAVLAVGGTYPLDANWGARVACYARVTKGMRDAGRVGDAAVHFRYVDGAMAAWWLGHLRDDNRERVVRALRILIGVVG